MGQKFVFSLLFAIFWKFFKHGKSQHFSMKNHMIFIENFRLFHFWKISQKFPNFFFSIAKKNNRSWKNFLGIASIQKKQIFRLVMFSERSEHSGGNIRYKRVRIHDICQFSRFYCSFLHISGVFWTPDISSLQIDAMSYAVLKHLGTCSVRFYTCMD